MELDSSPVADGADSPEIDLASTPSQSDLRESQAPKQLGNHI